jgi:hypothetical protein
VSGSTAMPLSSHAESPPSDNEGAISDAREGRCWLGGCSAV